MIYKSINDLCRIVRVGNNCHRIFEILQVVIKGQVRTTS